MPKAKISRRRKRSSKNIKKKHKELPMKPIKLKTSKGISKINPSKILKDDTFIIAALLQCFKENDSEGFIEILDGYIAAWNKSDFAEKANISRSTLYNMLSGRKNPTLRVLMQCVHELVT